MATVNYKVCDRCGKKIAGLAGLFINKPRKITTMLGTWEYCYELCTKCASAFYRFIDNKEVKK